MSARRARFNLSAWAIAHRHLTLFLMLAMLAAGTFAYFQLGQKEDPEFTFRAMVLRTFWPGASSGEMALQVTDRLEKKLQEIPHLRYVESYSKPGESLILVRLSGQARGEAVPEAWRQVRKKVDDMRHTLPEGVLGPFINDEFGDTFGSIYALSGHGVSYAELKDYAETVRTELLRVRHVAKVDLLGLQDETIYLEFSHRKLATLGLDPFQLANILRAQNAMTPAGVIQTPSPAGDGHGGGDQVWLRVSGDFESLDSIREVGVRANGHTFRLGDVATVTRGYVDPPEYRMRHRGREVIGIAVSMRDDGDVLELGEHLATTVDRLRASLPVGVEIDQVADQPRVVRESVAEFMRSLAEALGIVLLVSFLSLGLRTGLVVALTIPFVLALTFLGMKFLSIDLQRISLGALIIALGLLVDDAMIAVEMMAVKLEQGWDRIRAATIAYNTTAFPMLSGTLITAAGFMPVGLADSEAGEYVYSIFAVVTLALLISWFAAVTTTPYLGNLILKERARDKVHRNPYRSGFYPRFRIVVEWCLQHRWSVIGLTLLMFGVSIAGLGVVQKQFFPSSNRPELMVDLWLPEGSTFASTEAQARKLESMLARDPDVAHVTSYVGGGSPRFYLPLDQQMQHVNLAELVVMTRDPVARERVRARLDTVFAGDFPGVRARVQLLPNGPPVGYPVQFRVLGREPETLRRIANQAAAMLREDPDARDVNLNWNEKIKTVRLELDQDKARALGVSSQQVAIALQSVISGFTITQYREGDKLIDIIARAVASERDDLDGVADINIHTRDGHSVPLAQLGRVTLAQEEAILWRRDRLPAITVRCDVPDHVQPPDVSLRVDKKLDALRATLPPGYAIEMGGAAEESKGAEESIFAVMPIMLFVIVALLMIQLQSYSRALLVLLTAPLGIIGVVAALLAFRMPFGFVAQLGVIALSGMIMRNSVILVDQIEKSIASGAPAWYAIREAAVRRFRPIMLTAAAAVLAMIPLTRSIFWGPMAVAIMGGLVVATVLTLLFLPALYAACYRVRKPRQVDAGMRARLGI